MFKPSWATFSSTTGKLSGTPTAANVGSYKDIEIAVNNGLHAAVSRMFSIQVAAGRHLEHSAGDEHAAAAPPPSTGALTISGAPPVYR